MPGRCPSVMNHTLTRWVRLGQFSESHKGAQTLWAQGGQK